MTSMSNGSANEKANGSATDTTTASEVSTVVAALHRSMPFTRLVDCGMDHADARRLLTDTANGVPWDEIGETIAEAQIARSVAAAEAGRAATARRAARAAVAAYAFSHGSHNEDSEVKRRLVARQAAAMSRVVDLEQPRWERLLLDYDGGTLVGWLSVPPGPPPPTVVVWGGLSGWGSSYLPIADALHERGIACLLAEGPGQGQSRLVYGIYAGKQVASAFARFIDAVVHHPALGARVGIQGNSFGGLFAALLAAQDDRVDACVVNGAPARPFVPPYRTPREQLLALLGVETVEQAEEVVSSWQFPDHGPVTCPLLVLHGGVDPLVSRDEQEPFLAGADPATRELREWPDGEHTLYNHGAERNAVTADWFADRLGGAPSPS